MSTPLPVHLDTLPLGARTLRDVHLTGTITGRPLGTAPIAVLIGGITADDRPFGADGAPGWWPALLGPDRVDPDRFTVLAPALTGKGTTWSGLDDPTVDPPALDAGDLADLVAAWLDALGAAAGATVVGASLGGIVALALAARHPHRVSRLVVVSAGARPDGWGTGLRHLQREVVRHGQRGGDISAGMNLARQLGMLTYRGRAELDARFPATRGADDAPAIAAWLDHHGRRFARTFPARSFLLLSDAIDRPAFGHDRPAIRQALAAIRARVVVVGVPDDLLFPFRLQKELVEDLRHAGVDASLRTLPSVYGHDAFLADQEALAAGLVEAGVFAPPPEPQPAPQPAEAGAPPVRTIRLGLIGCGVVGAALLDLLAERRDALARRHGLRFEVVGIALRDVWRDRGPAAEGLPRTSDALALVRDPLVDVVVEVAGGQGEVADALRAALEAGKPVVTANKALLAAELGPLAALSARTRAPLVCEAAAAAALPVMRSLARQVDRPRRLAGIVNGTCNFILTRMEESMSLTDALAIAQARGFAEADPTADIDGHDAAAKLTLLVGRTFGAWIRPDAFSVRGLRALHTSDIELAEALGHRLRLVAHAEERDGSLALAVEPVALPSWHLLAGVEEEFNAVYLTSDAAGDLAFFGRGAGGPPTASAVLSDLVDVALGTAAAWPEPIPAPLRPLDELPRRHLLRVDGPASPAFRRRTDTLVRRAGLGVRARAERRSSGRSAVAWLLDDAAPAAVEDLASRLPELAGASRAVVYGVLS